MPSRSRTFHYLCHMNRIKQAILFLVPCLFYLAACSSADLYEKSVSIPGHAWKSGYKPGFKFIIKDTSAPYELFLILRHNDKYSFNNIYINLSVKTPGSDSATVMRCDLRLANDNNGWLASGMDDIFEHRIKLTPWLVDNNISLRRQGEYEFGVQQIMREDPLANVLDVGLRVEKKQ